MSVREPSDNEVKQAAQNALRNAKTPIESLRAQCLKRGAKGISGLGRSFKIMDDDMNKRINKAEFTKGVHDYGVNLTSQQVDDLFGSIDRDKSGFLDFDEFLRALRPPMSERRVKLVMDAFKKLDKTGDGVITVADLKGVYNTRNHPKYLNGEWTEKQCLQAWLNNFEKDSNEKDGMITKDEFLDYYAGISSSIDEDPYFDLMMRSCWKM